MDDPAVADNAEGLAIPLMLVHWEDSGLAGDGARGAAGATGVVKLDGGPWLETHLAYRESSMSSGPQSAFGSCLLNGDCVGR